MKEKLNGFGSLMNQINIQISNNEVKEIFTDGKSHQIVFMNAVFIDGMTLNSPAFQPLVMVANADSFDQYQERFNVMMDALTKAHRLGVEEDLLAQRACALAALVFANEIMDGVPTATKAMTDAFTLIGTAMGIGDGWEKSFALPLDLRQTFREYLENTKVPKRNSDVSEP